MHYCRRGDLDKYIAKHHHNPEAYLDYRRRWERADGDLLCLQIETRSDCNLRCQMCIHSLGHRPFAEMSEETFSRILGYVDEMRVPSVSLCFTNEPLLDSRIIKFVEKASALDCVVDVMLTTNATLLDEEMSKRLLDSGLLRLWISFDAATKETYEKIRVGG